MTFSFSFLSNLFPFGVLHPVKLENFFSSTSFTQINVPLNFEYIFGNISFIVLFIAVLLYWFDFSDTQKVSKTLKTFCMIGSNFALTCLLLVRWWESGHFPLSNLYESLIGLSWSFTTVHLFITLDFSLNSKIIQKFKKGGIANVLQPSVLSDASLPCEGSKGHSFAPKQSLVVQDAQQQHHLLHTGNFVLRNEDRGPSFALAGATHGEAPHDLQFKNKRNFIEISTNPISDKIGAIIAPTALLTSVFANFFLPSEMLKTTSLIPALKSNWLTMHVTVMIISYAFLIIGSLLSIAFCAYRFALLKLVRGTNLVSSPDLKDGQNVQEQNLKGFSRELVMPSTQSIGTGQAYSILSQSMDSTFQEERKKSNVCSNKNEWGFIDTYNYSSTVNLLSSPSSNSIARLSNTGRTSHITSQKNDCEQIDHSIVSMELEPKKVQYDICIWLNTMSYRVLGLGFPLLTIGILSGAVWANEAWGSYWSWDPKETWALITWLVFAVYFHSRYNRSSDISVIPASIASFGFVVIWICYLGVNLLGSGLHSYGWFAFLSFYF